MTYSTIIQKTCKCGCGKYPTIGFQGYAADCRPDLKQALIDKVKKRNALKLSGTKLRNLAKENSEVKAPKDYKSKSQLLKDADRLFGDFVKNRDKESFIDEETGDVVDMVKCPCCFKYYDLEAKAFDGSKIVNVLHFVDRDVYSLRFDEDNAHAGCCYCNLDQHLHPKGKTYKNYRLFMVEKFGEQAISEMELAHRKINRIEEQQLKTVIEHYGNIN